MAHESRWIKWLAHGVLMTFSIACLIPFALLIISSISSEQSIINNGYSFLPQEFSLKAYDYLWAHWGELGRAYGITVFITVVGTAASLAMAIACLRFRLNLIVC